MSTGSELEGKIQEWLEWDRNSVTTTAIQKLTQEENYHQLSKVLLHRLSFGTAGLRGKMAAGYACMNDLVIIQTGQGLLDYLERRDTPTLKQNGIVIGYDGRRNSQKWANLTAAIFSHKNYPVRLFSQVVPTPFVPFAVSKYGAAIGVMITASHNPKDDNGYKVYDSNGAQIISPIDKDIQASILKNLKPLETSWDTSILQSNLLSDPLSEILQNYLNILDSTILEEHKILNGNMKILFTYTAMHGVGYQYVKQAFEKLGLKMIPVSEQKDPDPDFPTVEFPNPEEGKSSLNLSIKTADENGSSVIIANDPDADRMAAAEKKNGVWKVFTGNELGALLGWWSLFCYKKTNSSLEDTYMLSSTVSSMILRSMSRQDGFNFIETLTGFKWMGNKMFELMKSKTVLFAFEEAIGYCFGTAVLDKDGVSAACHLATLTSFLYHQKKSLSDKLEEIYLEYGYHVSLNSYFICHDGDKIKKIFNRIRNFSGPDTYPNRILKDVDVSSVRDLTTGFDSSQPDKKAILPVSSSTQMITFNFSNGLVCTLRTSGTEPKIKYYTEMCAEPGDKRRDVIESNLKNMVNAIIDLMLQPEVNDLTQKSD